LCKPPTFCAAADYVGSAECSRRRRKFYLEKSHELEPWPQNVYWRQKLQNLCFHLSLSKPNFQPGFNTFNEIKVYFKRLTLVEETFLKI
jgi:hypothetical protein